MKSLFENYLQSISLKFSREQTGEMGYRTEFEILLKKIFESIKVKNIDHDAKFSDGNKPDFAIIKHEVPILYIETKDIGISLDKVEKSEQMARYFGYANLVLTDYLEFRFYRNGQSYGEPIKIGDYDLKTRIITPNPKNFDNLAKTLLDFTKSHKEPIKSGKHLSKIMGGKAQRIRDNIRDLFSFEKDKKSDLMKLYETIKRLLVHDLTKDAFADMYAQTLVYGLFVARFYDKTPGNFTRQEARDLIPKSNPLLRDFFDHIVGPNFDKRLEYIVNELCEVFSHADIEKLMKQYFQKGLWGNEKNGSDPVIHFYEDFLKEYDPELRKKMGAYYTPLPVVMFIARSVDYLLKNKFGLSSGLADTSKTINDLHRVQILDPAVGTGTFISAVIRIIYEGILKSGQKGRWPKYVHNDLLPRIHGFELMMAPYTIAHLKLALAFKETGFKHFNRRLGIYLTNSLEESVKQQELFNAFGLAESIAEESKEASIIKNKTPIMVVIGNPPYSGESSNAQYTDHDVYKVEPTGGKLQERNSKWLNDDYVKFFRFTESMVEKSGEGIVAMITAHGYIDNPTFRGMRWHLMKTFDEIYVLDLHGNANKKEKAPDGSQDKNVFNIKTGVSIFFGIKKKDSKSDLAKIYKADLFGKRRVKFEYLNKNIISSVKWKQIAPISPNYEWVISDEKKLKEYNKGFSINELFPISSVGIVTSRDKFIIDSDKNTLKERLQSFLRCQSTQEAKAKFNLKENKKWKIKNVLKHKFDEKNIIPINYRPLDAKFIYFHDDFIERSRKHIMVNLFSQNIGLVARRQMPEDRTSYFFISKLIMADGYIRSDNKGSESIFPLYIYQKNGHKKPNLNKKIVDEVEKIIGKISLKNLFDCIYAILHSPNYRKKYQEFLKTDFPRIPYPKNNKSFKNLAKLGKELRQLHLLESPKVNKFITTYPETGSDTVEKPVYKNGNVYINEKQYFGNVPEVAWNFYIGGYQPAQKWLKDRKGKTLTNSDIEHYQKIIVVLTETEKIMGRINQIF